MSLDAQHTDAILVQRLITGDREAFESIYRKYWEPLHNQVYKRVKDKQKAEDLVQEVFYKLWRRKEQLTIGQLENYLRTAVRYETLNYLSRTRMSYEFFEPFQEILQEENLPDGDLISKELVEMIHAYAATLPEKRRQIFLMHFQQKLSTREIADALHISRKTVQNQLNTAITGLKPHILPLIAGLMAAHYS